MTTDIDLKRLADEELVQALRDARAAQRDAVSAHSLAAQEVHKFPVNSAEYLAASAASTDAWQARNAANDWHRTVLDEALERRKR